MSYLRQRLATAIATHEPTAEVGTAAHARELADAVLEELARLPGAVALRTATRTIDLTGVELAALCVCLCNYTPALAELDAGARDLLAKLEPDDGYTVHDETHRHTKADLERLAAGATFGTVPALEGTTAARGDECGLCGAVKANPAGACDSCGKLDRPPPGITTADTPTVEPGQ